MTSTTPPPFMTRKHWDTISPKTSQSPSQATPQTAHVEYIQPHANTYEKHAT